MGYRVDYAPMDRAYRGSSCRVQGWPVLCVTFFLGFLILVCSFWAEGREVLSRLLFPGNWDAVEEALTVFRSAAESGESAAVCAEVFCKEILSEAGCGIG